MNTELLKRLRKERGWKQADVAAELGIGRTTYVSYEKGQIDPPLYRLKRIAALFGVTLDEIA